MFYMGFSFSDFNVTVVYKQKLHKEEKYFCQYRTKFRKICG